MKRFLRNATMAAAIVLASGSAAAEPTVLLDVDFSEKCTAGTEAEPQMFRYSSDFTGSTGLGYTGWRISSASKLGQAGGSLYISDGAYVQTPYLSNVTTTNGAIRVTLEVKLNNTNMGIAQMKWSTSTNNAEIYTDDWTTVEYIITPTSPSSYSNYAQISPFLVADGMFLKSVKIEQGKEFLGAPVVYLPSDANGSSFTARWKSVSGATKYYLDVYSHNAAGEKVIFISNQEVTPATASASYISYKVEGLNPDTIYYYVVRAANDEGGLSADSEEIEVVKVISSLDKPVVKVVTEADGTYTAAWDAITDAQKYFVNVVRRQTLAEAGNANVLLESFDCFTTGTVEDFQYAYNRHLEMLNEEGWTGDEMLYYNGGMGLTPYSTGEAYLATPALNLADNNGKVTVVITAAARKAGSFTNAGALRLVLLDADDKAGEPVELKLDVNGFNTYTVELEGGTAASKVKVYDFNNDGSVRYFFNDITVQQVKPAGYVNVTNYADAEVDTNSYSGKVENEVNTAYYITVTAGAETVVSGEVGNILSDPSDEVLIASFSGVENVTVGGVEAVAVKSLGNGVIEVTAADDTVVEVYDLAGRKIAAEAVVAGVNTLSVNATGVAIVKAGTVVAKVIL